MTKGSAHRKKEMKNYLVQNNSSLIYRRMISHLKNSAFLFINEMIAARRLEARLHVQVILQI